MLNIERYRSIDAIFKSRGIELPDKDVMLYADAFEIIASLLNSKLSDEEMVRVVDFLGDLITGNVPHMVAHVSKGERLRVQYPMMEKMAATRGKLTPTEKELLAFCVYWMNCVQVYDEKRAITVSGLVDFTSVEKILSLYEYEKKQRPAFFSGLNPKPVINREMYGLTLDNPVRVTSISDAYAYLKILRYNNQPVPYVRIGSFSGKDGHLVDKYVLTITQRKFLSEKQVKVDIFIDSYATEAIILPPPDFTLA